MTTYMVDYSYDVEEFGCTVVEADDKEEAEMFGLEHVRDTYPEARRVVIDRVREI